MFQINRDLGILYHSLMSSFEDFIMSLLIEDLTSTQFKVIVQINKEKNNYESKSEITVDVDVENKLVEQLKKKKPLNDH